MYVETVSVSSIFCDHQDSRIPPRQRNVLADIHLESHNTISPPERPFASVAAIYRMVAYPLKNEIVSCLSCMVS